MSQMIIEVSRETFVVHGIENFFDRAQFKENKLEENRNNFKKNLSFKSFSDS